MTAMICEEYIVVRAMGNGAEVNGNDWKGAGGDWRLGLGRVNRGRRGGIDDGEQYHKMGHRQHSKYYYYILHTSSNSILWLSVALAESLSE